MELLAYHRYLARESKCNRVVLATKIFTDCYADQNPMAFDLLELTGDKEYNQDTFFKSADLIINEINKENGI